MSIRPQPTRAPRGEVMALGPSRWGDPAWVVAGGPTPVWDGGGMARDPAAAALRLSLAVGAARGVSGAPPPMTIYEQQNWPDKNRRPRGSEGGGVPDTPT